MQTWKRESRFSDALYLFRVGLEELLDLVHKCVSHGAVEQAISVATQQPYTSLKSAWRYRKEFVQGCSCKEAEYVPAPGAGDKKADAAPAPSPARSEARLAVPR